jgi:hypothetical protein
MEEDRRMTDLANELALIRQTQARYNLAGDRLRLEELAATFLPDGVLEVGTTTMTLVGRKAIAEGLNKGGMGGEENPRAQTLTLVRHNLTTSLIELTGADTAVGRTYFQVFTDIGPDHFGVYIDRFRKVGAEWFIEHRKVQIDWVAENSLFSTTQDAHKARLAARAAARQG